MSDRAVYIVWIELTAAAMVAGVYGAWVKVGPSSLAGTTAGSRGWIVFAAALVAAGVAWFRRATRSAGVYVFVAGAVALAAAVYDRTHLAAIIGGGRVVTAAAGAGWGLYLALAASILLAVAGLVWVAALADLPWAWLEPSDFVT
jgi:hypothetical protein